MFFALVEISICVRILTVIHIYIRVWIWVKISRNKYQCLNTNLILDKVGISILV